MKVLKARADVVFTYAVQSPGTRLVAGNLPAVMTGQDALLLEEVQPPGKKPMDGKSFLAGGREWK